MGFLSSDLPVVDMATWSDTDRSERIHLMARHIAERRCHFDPSEVRIVMIDGQPIHRQRQEYRLVDAATGEFERGTFEVGDCVARQPWQHDVPVRVLN